MLISSEYSTTALPQINDKPLKAYSTNYSMVKNHRTLIIILTLLAIIAVGIYIRSNYVRPDGKYLLAFDPYYHYRMAETIVEEGSRPEWDVLAAHPTGSPVRHPPLFHYYLAYTYKVVDIFSDMTLFQWCIYANIIPIILAIVAAFYAGKVITNEIGGLFTALFAAVNGAFSSRTLIGYTDTDIWIVLFSFAVIYFLFRALKSEEKHVWSFLCGFSLFLFALTWRGNSYLLLLVFSAFVLFLLVDAVRKQVDKDLLSVFALSFLSFMLPWTVYSGYYITGLALFVLGILWFFGGKISVQIKNPELKRLVIPVICIVIVVITAKVFYDEGVFTYATQNAAKLLGITSPSAKAAYLPDISVSIVQRFPLNLSAVSKLFSLLLLVAPVGLIFLLWKQDRFSLQIFVFLALCFLETGVIMLMGGRYTMLFAIPLILAAGAFFGILPEILQGKITSKGIFAAGAVCALVVIPCYMGGADVSTASSTMNDDLWELLTWAEETIPEDAVIISGWDMGYWIESVAKRKSVMDGNHYDIWWRVIKYGKLVETQDEKVAMKEIYGFLNESEVEALREFPEENEVFLTKEMQGFAEDNAYILVSEWSILTFYWLSYFGNWNYTTGEGEGRIYNPMWSQDARKLVSATEYIYGDQNIGVVVVKEDSQFHSFFLGEEGYIPTLGTLFIKDGQTYFLKREEGGGGIIYVPPETLPYFDTGQQWPDMPSEVFLITDEDLECMMTRLYFFNGEGLHYFELVKDCRTAKLYKVHKVPQEFDQGVITEEDTYVPI